MSNGAGRTPRGPGDRAETLPRFAAIVSTADATGMPHTMPAGLPDRPTTTDSHAMTINTAMTLRDIALSGSAAARVLETYRLDACCMGEQTLAEACRRNQLDLDDVFGALVRAQGESLLAPEQQTVTEQAGFISGRHHRFTRARLPRIQTLLGKVLAQHGGAHPELQLLADGFAELQAILASHLLQEEDILLPCIKALHHPAPEQAMPSPADFASIGELIDRNRREHKALGALLRQLRELSADFTPPTDACSTYRIAFQALEELETHLMHHIYLENEVLFPRLRQLCDGP